MPSLPRPGTPVLSGPARPRKFVTHYVTNFALLLVLTVAAFADDSRRLFDFTPVSATNPVVATIDGRIEIPLSELRGYRDAEQLNAITDPADLAQKRAVLDALLNEYLFVDEAYRSGVADSPGFARQMEATRTMVLTDFMAMRAASEKPAAVENGDAGAALAEELFEKASIEVSNEAYDLLKRAASSVDKTIAAAAPGADGRLPAETAAKLRELIEATPETTLVRYGDRTITVHQILAIYAGLPAEKRPPVQTQDGLIAMIKPLILPELMALEAAKRGLAADPAFQQKIIQNRNALLRFHMQGEVERTANARLQAPDVEAKLRAWHKLYQPYYTVAVPGGDPRPASYEEARGQVEGDYSIDVRDKLLAAKAQELRKARKITVDEAVLAKL